MRFWEENRRIVQGLVAALVVLGAAKLLVLDRFARRAAEMEQERLSLKPEIDRNHGPMERALEIAAARSRYKQRIVDLASELDEQKKLLQFAFPEYTAIPQDRDPAEYFRRKHAELREDLGKLCTGRVNLEDPNLGFEPKAVLDRKSAQEDLRRLAIVERLVKLLVDAKVHTIISLKHSEPKLTGARLLIPNPQYSPNSRVQALAQKYIVRRYPEFIREYPTTIELVTDIDPLMKFLYSVRQENQFLIIRTLDVASAEGQKDPDGNTLGPGKLRVVISAAGVSFLSEEERREIEKKRPQPGPVGPAAPVRPPSTEPIGA